MISLEWIQDYIDISDEDIHELADKITKAGVNIERVITNHIDHLVIGKVIECVNHPDSDHLHVCKVDVGEIIQIVCGASNVREGKKVIVALPGAVLPGNFEIKKGKIRGVDSNGMICALFELGLEEKTEENYNKGIHELDSNAPIGEDPIKYLKLNDTVYELDIHKHRNNDCYYHIGFAYEIGAILSKKVNLPVGDYTKLKQEIKQNLKVETDKCPYYLAKKVINVTVGESPEFIKRRLNAVGIRSINNVVDISNYVMLEYGQPLHFFDSDKLGDTIVVRDALENEKIVTLDGNERVLKSSDIVITDGIKPVCIAGVMGGENTEIDNNTKNILIESAIFESTSIRYTAARLNLKSEASIRYGKGLNYEYTNSAIERACYLLERYANASVLTGTVMHDNIDKKIKKVNFSVEDINKMLGIKISSESMKVELERLNFEYKFSDDKFDVIIPNRRLDIDPFVNDIAEEIGRLYGYHNLKSTLPVCSIKPGVYVGDVKYRKLVSKRLRCLGLNETKTYTLTSPELAKLFKHDNKTNVILPNPMSIDKSVVRTSILPSLLNVYDYNKARKVKDVLIYEISKTYDETFNEESKIAVLMKGNYLTNDWQHNSVKVDFYVIKGILENILDYLGFKNRYTFVPLEIDSLHPGKSASVLLDREEIGFIGAVHPSLVKDDIYVFEISMNKLIKNVKPIKYKESSKYPAIVKDVSFIVPNDITSQEIVDVIKKTGGRLLESVKVFDLYTSDTKSIAYSLTFNDSTKTLTDTEVNSLFEQIMDSVTTKLNCKVKSI